MDVKENIAKNIVLLRKSRNWKQSDLAEKLHYTDKAISKWERNESTPDIEALVEIAHIFGVSVEFLLQENESVTTLEDEKKKTTNRISVLVLIVTAIFFISTIIFVYGFINNEPAKYSMWVAFVWGAFVSIAVSYVYLRRFKYRFLYPYFESGIIWSALATGYCQALVLGENVWMIFLVGVPLQIGVVLSALIKK